jgi:hypothetical protein
MPAVKRVFYSHCSYYIQADRKLRMASAAPEHYAVGWSCGGSARCPRFFCHDLPRGRLGHNCTSTYELFFCLFIIRPGDLL